MAFFTREGPGYMTRIPINAYLAWIFSNSRMQSTSACTLLHFDWASLVLALQQDALILLLLLAFSFAAWQLSGWRLEGDLLTIQLGILFHLRQQVRIPELASAVVTRPFFFRPV